MDSSLSEAPRGSVVSASSDPTLHQYVIPNKSMEYMESISGGSLSQNLIISHMQMGQVDVKAGNFGQQQFQIHDNQFRGTGNMMRPADGLSSLPVKRKASVEPLNSFSQQPLMHNKRVSQMEHRPWLQQVSGIAKKPLQIQNNAPVPTPMHSPAPNKRKVQQMETHPVKAGHQRSTVSKSQSTLQNPISKIQNESIESVRSKMRESLTSALALVSQQDDKSTNDEKSHPTEAEKSTVNSIPSDPDVGNISEDSMKKSSAKIDFGSLDNNGVEKTSNNSLELVNDSELEALRYNGLEFQSNNVLSYEDISFGDSFFIKDDLLQGNGLSWVMENDLAMADRKEIQPVDQKLDIGAAQALKAVQTPEGLAFKIEEELFKLFGGVNKKYKEKGRSLLFNLKDRSNPELRERVMHGEISPERLCSMTAEELASKELSEWRMAKAEEFAQMVVLPDSEVDIRRLVKKTHKGEFQVQFEEHYDNSSTDVSAGATSFSQGQHNKKETEGVSPDEPETIKDDRNISAQKNGADGKGDYMFTIASSEGSDLMQGLMVDDGLKDTELLPPIVSLDEFMESLNSEPPFDILPENADKSLPVLGKGDPEVAPGSKASVDTTKNATDVSIDKNKNDSINSSSIDLADVKSSDDKTDGNSNENQARLRSLDKNDSMKSSESNAKSGSESLASTFRVDHLWEGILQLNITTMTSVVGTYISGERTSARDWPGILEIKGRVRLDAFEKFLHELPLSRSRAVMVLHLDLKDGCPESERASLQEVAESYVMDERVGIAEPGSGVEFYFCPPHRKILEMLGRILLKENDEALNTIDNGLIGVVVWRKTQLMSMSPNSTSHTKRSSKKQHFSSRRQQETNMKANNISPKQTMPPGFPLVTVNPAPQDDGDGDDDDVPPGFGPSTNRDDDDLPEFNFSGAVNPSPRRLSRPPSFHSVSQNVSRPVDQMRELVHKYGQNLSNPSTGNWQDRGFGGVDIQPWNDDDDDIPEWQPQAPQNHMSSAQPVHGNQQPTLRPHYMANQPQQHFGQATQLLPPPSLMQAPSNVVTQQQQGAWWVPQPGQGNNIQSSNLGSQASSSSSGSQFYGSFGRVHPGMNPRQDAPNSRRF